MTNSTAAPAPLGALNGAHHALEALKALLEAHDIRGKTHSPHWSHTLAVFDLETTGIDFDISRIVTAHVGVIGPTGQVLAACDWIIDPGIEIPTSATLIHGISTERAQREGDEPAQAVAQILTALQYLHQRGVAIVAYNAAYDFTILQHEAIRYGLTPFPESGPIIDPFVIDKAVDRYRPGKRTLSATAEHYGVNLRYAHDAAADAVTAGRIAQALVHQFPLLADTPASHLHELQSKWSRQQAAGYQRWRRENGEPNFVSSGEWPVRHQLPIASADAV
ncbi:MAG: hypothetical protein B5766_05765 [Candidatus Lumbricidophila eiseniae]|uniref:Exonuclease domain-containing protein n=1 Tax=Candidatus Lumbricidiphila eiseniae TaxID=1969409 RepID=A0A2A6FRR6_9MICO|nr:MAG: hypothetical protein B5766_05765 [Candidatus Lumbricidophila eiseniae]